MKERKMHRDTFILRIWLDEDKPGWTGQVQHVGSGQSALFQSLDKLLAFIERRTGKLSGTERAGLK
jgi:hypothetical protein